MLDRREQLPFHRHIVDAVHAAGAPICLQVLHAGRYRQARRLVGASDIASPINRRKPHALTDAEVERTVEAFVECAALAQEAAIDGVEMTGSEGYLITQFTSLRTNNRAALLRAGRSRTDCASRSKSSGEPERASVRDF